MHILDGILLGGYFAAMLAVGAFFLRRQDGIDAYFVGDRKMGAGHVGLSVVATDVGGGFSIGLGGLGFAMGLSGSWLLFTGLIGAWLSAVIVIPRVKQLGDEKGWLTFPDFLEHRFDARTRLLAGVVSAIGYAGFVGGQILAGAKLGAVAFEVDQTTAVLLMAFVVVAYTALGGLQAVVYTDTVQWVVLFFGLVFCALPLAFQEVGGFQGLREKVPAEHLSLTNVDAMTLVTWAVTIIPIWFVGNTLYQRIYATKDEKSAKRAWYFAGLLEYPCMAFMGTALGVMARALYPEVDPELGLPLLIKDVLPVGLMGIVLAVYFSAIMSTADSCLLASVGHFMHDLYAKTRLVAPSARAMLRLSRWLTVIVGAASVFVALWLPRVLDAVLLAYGFMVSGLFVPTLAGLLWPRATKTAAFWSMVTGGGLVLTLSVAKPLMAALPGDEPILIALPASLLVMVALSLLSGSASSSGSAPREQVR